MPPPPGDVDERGGRRPPAGGGASVPPPQAAPPPPADVPILAEPRSTDATDLLTAVLAVRMKNGDEQLKSSIEEVRFKGDVQRTKNEEISKKLEDQLKEMDKSKGLGGFLKALQWIGVGLTVAIAALTLNPVAIAGAVMAVSMAVLNETGVMDKMTNAIADSLQKDGMSEDTAKKWAMGLTMAITIAASLTSLGAGAVGSTAEVGASVVGLAAKLGQTAANVATTVVEAAPQLAIATKIASAAVTVTQAGGSIAKGQVDKDIADKSADIADIKAYLAKIKATMDDETDRIQAMVQASQDVVSRAFSAMNRVSETNSEIIRHMA